tara:strand:- start:206 stop:550 length:345 start_codon:yes stop_codon:yes gene_type:complete
VEKQNQNSKQLLEDINKIVNEKIIPAGDTESNFEKLKPNAQQRAAAGNEERRQNERRQKIISPEEKKKIIDRRMAERRKMKGSGEKKSAVDTMNDIVNRLGDRQKQEVDTSKLR